MTKIRHNSLLEAWAASVNAQAQVQQSGIDVMLGTIINLADRMSMFWKSCHGWASKDAADLLASARLDRQLSFAHTLREHFEPFPQHQAEAKQILGYATLRSMCEGALKLFFAVWIKDYTRNPLVDWKKRPIAVTDLSFDRLIAYYSKVGESEYEVFLRRVQHRGNAIHHFVDRDIGTHEELKEDIFEFRDFLFSLNSRLPYPDEMFNSVNY